MSKLVFLLFEAEIFWVKEESSVEDVVQTGFGGYQHPGTVPAFAARGPSASAGPVDKRYYLGAAATSPGAAAITVPDTEPLDLGGMKIVVKEPRKKQGKKHLKAKIVTELALPAGASPSATSSKKPQESSKDALGAVNLDDDLSESEKKMLQHKTYPGATAASSPVAVVPVPKKTEVLPATAASDVSSEGGKKRKAKKVCVLRVCVCLFLFV